MLNTFNCSVDAFKTCSSGTISSWTQGLGLMLLWIRLVIFHFHKNIKSNSHLEYASVTSDCIVMLVIIHLFHLLFLLLRASGTNRTWCTAENTIQINNINFEINTNKSSLSDCIDWVTAVYTHINVVHYEEVQVCYLYGL